MKSVINHIREKLDEMEKLGRLNLGYSDLGNFIGIAIGECAEEEQVEDFKHGFQHGVSITDGTHPQLR